VAAEPLAHCPVDDWDFRPRYTDGCCPLCGWQVPGVRVSPPLAARVDWFWPMVGLLAAISVTMLVLVVVAFNR